MCVLGGYVKVHDKARQKRKYERKKEKENKASQSLFPLLMRETDVSLQRERERNNVQITVIGR